MKTYDYRAVVYAGDVYCIGCLPPGVDVEDEDCSPIFADSEWDCVPTCVECSEDHDYVTLLQEPAE